MLLSAFGDRFPENVSFGGRLPENVSFGDLFLDRSFSIFLPVFDIFGNEFGGMWIIIIERIWLCKTGTKRYLFRIRHC